MAKPVDGVVAPGRGNANYPALTHKKVTVEGLAMTRSRSARAP